MFQKRRYSRYQRLPQRNGTFEIKYSYIFKKSSYICIRECSRCHVDGANSILSKHGYPCKGVVLQEDEDGEPFAQIGFARSNGDFGTKQMLDLYDKYQVPVEIYGYILNVDPSRIQDQRETWVDSFDSTMLWVKQHSNENTTCIPVLWIHWSDN